MAELKQVWTGYASGAHGGASGWFPQIKNEATPKTSKKNKQKTKNPKKKGNKNYGS